MPRNSRYNSVLPQRNPLRKPRDLRKQCSLLEQHRRYSPLPAPKEGLPLFLCKYSAEVPIEKKIASIGDTGRGAGGLEASLEVVFGFLMGLGWINLLAGNLVLGAGLVMLAWAVLKALWGRDQRGLGVEHATSKSVTSSEKLVERDDSLDTKSAHMPTAFNSENGLAHERPLCYSRLFSDVVLELKNDKEESQLNFEDGRFEKSFSVVEEVGGKNSGIFLVRHKLDQKLYNVHRIFVTSGDVENLKNSALFKKLSDLSELDHPSIGKLVTFWAETVAKSKIQTKSTFDEKSDSKFENILEKSTNHIPLNKNSFEQSSVDEQHHDSTTPTDIEVFLQTEFVGKNSISHILLNSTLDVTDRFLIFNKVLSTLEFLHSKSICHGNLSLNTIFFEEDEVKLSNFNFSGLSSIPAETFDSTEKLVRSSNSIKTQETFKTDLNALGLALFQMLTGTKDVSSAKTLLEEVRSTRRSHALMKSFPEEIQIALSLTEKNSKFLPTFSDVKASKALSEWRNNVIDVLEN